MLSQVSDCSRYCGALIQRPSPLPYTTRMVSTLIQVGVVHRPLETDVTLAEVAGPPPTWGIWVTIRVLGDWCCSLELAAYLC